MRAFTTLVALGAGGAVLALAVCAAASGRNYGAENFLALGSGARAAGMGNAFTALADDGSGVYWNPGAPDFYRTYRYQAAAQYLVLPQAQQVGGIAYAASWRGVGTIGLGWAYQSLGGLEGRDAAGEPTAGFQTHDQAWLIGFSRRMDPWLGGVSVGVNSKLFFHRLAEFQASGFGLDAGLLYQPFAIWGHTLGLTISNLFQTTRWNTSLQERAPLGYHPSLALRFWRDLQELEFHHLNVVWDADFFSGQTLLWRLGAEYWPVALIGARLGYNQQTFSAGVSYRPSGYSLDYAFIYDAGGLALHQHRFSVTLRFF